MTISADIGIRVHRSTDNYTYELLQADQVIGSAKIQHLANDVYEFCYLEVKEVFRKNNLGSALTLFAIYNHPAKQIFATSVIPAFFQKIGFTSIPMPNFVDHASPDCQICNPKKCTALSYVKPAELTRLEPDNILFSEYLTILKSHDFLTSEFSFMNWIGWAYIENLYAINIAGARFLVSFPFLEEAFGVIIPWQNTSQEAIRQFLDFLKEHDIHKIRHLTNCSKLYLQKVISAEKILEERNDFDYLYKTTDFASFAGSKYEKRRNRLKKFIRNNPQHSLHEYQPAAKNKVLEFAERIILKEMKISIISLEVLKNMLNSTEISGLTLESAGTIIGILIYSEINPKTIVVHFELVDGKYDGGGALLNNHLGKITQNKYTFINREQDLGLPGLRKSKLEYRPYRLLKKFQANI